MLRAADIRYCVTCRRVAPYDKHGACKRCIGRKRRAARVVKRAVLGHPLVSYRQLLTVADNVWSVWVRAFWGGCEVCSRPAHPSELQCMHGFSRMRLAVRFHDDNTFSGCPACHVRNTPPGPDWWEWMRRRLVERLKLGIGRGGPDPFERLKLAVAARGGRLTTLALHGVLADSQARIAALPAGPHKDWALQRAEQELSKLVRLAA